MATVLLSRQAIRASGPRRILSCSHYRPLSTLDNHPHIYVFPDPRSLSNSHLLTLLPTEPPSSSLAIGTTTSLPLSPNTFTENTRFTTLMQDVLKHHASSDSLVISQARAHASSTGSSPSAGASSPLSAKSSNPGSSSRATARKTAQKMAGADAPSPSGPASQAGVGGYIHLSDSRRPPDFGRIAEPEDIFGSLEVDGDGEFVQPNGAYQPSGTYRVVTNDGILGLSSFLLDKIVERLKVEEQAQK